MNSKYLYKTEKFINEKAIQNSSSYVLEKNNLILSIYATIGIPTINKINVALPQSVLGFRFNNNYNLEFMYYLFLNSYSKFKYIAETGSQPNISLKNIKKLIVRLPSIQEQERIAHFFSLLDKQIELYETKLQLNELIKKYYLHNLFINSQCTTVPKLRFNRFEGDWKITKLLNICEKNNCLEISSSHFLDAPAIMNKKYSKYNGEKFKQSFKQSIVFIKDGSNSGEFFYNYYDSKIATTCEQIYTNQNNHFIFYILDKNKANIKAKWLIGETIPHLYKANLLELSFYIPLIKEQEKIANFFSLLDFKIEQIQNLIFKLKLVKQYYLDKMFA